MAKYKTIEEASKATIALGLTSIGEYKAGYKQGGRLPAKPYRIYSDDWVNFGKWNGFLGNTTKGTYPTIQEASEAVIALGFTSLAEYKAGYKKNARLP
jgi:hypothetical protein